MKDVLIKLVYVVQLQCVCPHNQMVAGSILALDIRFANTSNLLLMLAIKYVLNLLANIYLVISWAV